MTTVLRSIVEMQNWRRQHESARIGFVPTMGALHAGHKELLKKARLENEFVILSIFVNQTQFNSADDFKNYPQTWDEDLEIAKNNHVDIIFSPVYNELYADQYKYKITENSLSLDLCGAHRPGHFDGVLSVVMKLFLITRPAFAYFGEKDFQQLTLIQGMVDAFFLDVKITAVPTVRESSGLALSSRNQRLSPLEKEKASLIYKALKNSKTAEDAKINLEKQGFIVDYLKDISDRRYAAAQLGKVRLIDNVKI